MTNNNNPSDVTVLPCPFCGSEATLEQHNGLTMSKHHTAQVTCGYCEDVKGAFGSDCVKVWEIYTNPAKAALTAAKAVRGNSSESAQGIGEPDVDTCPKCGGIADNGFSRDYPPVPYYCTKCDPTPPAEAEG